MWTVFILRMKQSWCYLAGSILMEIWKYHQLCNGLVLFTGGFPLLTWMRKPLISANRGLTLSIRTYERILFRVSHTAAHCNFEIPTQNRWLPDRWQCVVPRWQLSNVRIGMTAARCNVLHDVVNHIMLSLYIRSYWYNMVLVTYSTYITWMLWIRSEICICFTAALFEVMSRE